MKIKILLFILMSVTIFSQSHDVNRFVEFPTKIVNHKDDVIMNYNKNEYYFKHKIEYNKKMCDYYTQIMQDCGSSKYEDVIEYLEKRGARKLLIHDSMKSFPRSKYIYKNLIYVIVYDKTKRDIMLYVSTYRGVDIN